MKDRNESNEDTADDEIGNRAGDLKKGLGYLGNAAKGAGEKLHPIIGKVGKVAGVVKEAMADPEGEMVEKIVCGAANVLVQGALGARMIGEGAIRGAAVMPPHPYAKIAGGVLGGAMVAPIVGAAVKPYGEAAQKGCHVAFDYFKKGKQEQKEAAQKIVTEQQARDKAINGFKPNIPTTIPIAQNSAQNIPYRPYSYYPYQQPRAMFAPYNYAMEARILLLRANISSSDRMHIERLIDNACFVGYGYLSCLGSFSNSLSMTGLIGSYNGYNISSMVRDAIRSCGEIGGVATEVALITDLIDSEAHALASEYFLCFLENQFPFSISLVQQLEQELAIAYFKHKTLPFFSLHFNNDGFLYPVIHPAFEGTLVGEVIALLDYWMKGFLNGGVFDREFLKKWHEKANCDESSLRNVLIDLKEYCKKNINSVGYISLRELESRYGLKSHSGAYSQPFMTSFRIISHQAKVSRHGNVLLLNPGFNVEYSIDLMPDYKEYLEKYHQEHGDYPADYENTRRCYELFAEEIKKKMPQIPLFKDYFQLLGIMNSFCYAYVTFEKMGKKAIIPKVSETEKYAVPKAFPPLPVRYFRNYLISMTLQQLLNTTSLQEQMDVAVFRLFADRTMRSMPEDIKQSFHQEIKRFIRVELTNLLDPKEVFEDNEEEIERINLNATRLIYSQVIQVHAAYTRKLQSMITVLDDGEQKQLRVLPLPKKIDAVREALAKHVSLYKERWQALPHLSQETMLQAFSSEWQEIVKNNIKEIKRLRAEKLEIFTLLCKEHAGILPLQEKKSLRNVSEEQKEESDSIRVFFQKLQTELEADFEEKLQQGLSNQAELNQAKEILEENSRLITQQITNLQQHRAAELAKIPAHLYALNAANIAAFTTPLDQEITRLTNIKTDMENKCVLVVEELKSMKEALREASLQKEGFIANVKKEIAEKRIADLQQALLEDEVMAIKQEALRLLDLFDRNNLVNLENCSKVISRFSQTLLAEPELANMTLTEHYTHAIMGFTSKDLAQKTGDNFQIIGGCGMAVPNVQTKPLEHGDDFCKALAEASLDYQKGQAIRFHFNSQGYIAYSLEVQDMRNILQPAVQNEAQTTLLRLIKGDLEAQTVTESICTESLDPSESCMMHYAAAILDADRFNQLKGDPFLMVDKLGNLPLHFAAQSGNIEVIGAILSKNPRLVDAKNNAGLTPLIMAIQNNHLDVVKQLVSFQADCTVRLPNGLFPLYISLQNNFTEIALFLINNVPNLHLNETIDSKMTALHLAIDTGSLEVALTLIEKGASCTIKRRSDGFTPLFCAVKKDAVELIKAMCGKGVSLQVILDSGKSVLHLAAEAGQLDCLLYLLNQDIDVDAVTLDGNSALMLAIRAGFVAEAQALAFKAKLNQCNHQKQTASLLAIKYSMPVVSDILIERGEDPALMDDQGYNYLYYLVRNGEAQRFLALVEAKKIDFSLKYQNDTLFELAAKYRQFLIVFSLMEQNQMSSCRELSLLEYAVIADEVGYVRRNAQNGSAKLACLAAQHGSVRSLEWLLKKSELSMDQLSKAVKIALEDSNSSQAIELLIQKLADINQELDIKGNTALHLATAAGSRLVIELLLSFGCDVQVRNKEGSTAFHIALMQEDDWLLKRLLKLTKPSEWPGDLWQTTAVKPSAPLAKILAVYHKRLPVRARKHPSLPVNKPIEEELPMLIMTKVLLRGLQQLEDLLEEANYEEIVEYLQENPDILCLFKSKQGAHLLKMLFDTLCDNSKLLASLEQDTSQEIALVWSPDRLLALLKDKGINPVLLVGEHNVILSMIKVKSDKDALYRLRVFARHFPESVAPLAMAHYSAKISVIELALKLNKVALFEALTEHCHQANSSKIPSLYGLHEAILSNHYNLVQSMMKKYPVNSLNQKRQTPLMLAASMDNVPIMELLLAHGALPCQVDGVGKNALHYALQQKAQSAALWLLPLLKAKNQPDRHGVTPLMLAAAKGALAILRLLCEQGDFSESFDHRGWNALHYAALEGQVESVRYLVKQGFALNVVENPENPKKSEKCQKRSPIHLAALRGHTQVVHELINLEAKVEKEDANQQTVFEYGVRSKNIELLQYLQEHPLYYTKERGTALLLAAALVDNEGVVGQLILSDVNINSMNDLGCTALHFAAITNSGKVAELIIQGGDAALDMTDRRMRTPLHCAAEFGHVWLIELLCEAGATINYHNGTTATALCIACEQGKTGAVAALLKYGADVSIPNKDGLTPMEIASAKGYHDILNLMAIKPVASISSLLVRNGIYRLSVPKTIAESTVTAHSLS